MNAFIYLRVSTSKQEKDGAGLDVQLDVCTRYCQERGYRVVRVFQDAHTGFEYRERAALTELRTLIRDRVVDTVIFYAMDRLSRDQTHLAVLLDEAEHVGVTYDSATEDFEDTPEGKLVRQLRGYVAEVEREKILMRTQGGLRKRVESGKMLAGFKSPYGYRWHEEDGRKVAYEIIESEAAIIRRMYLSVLNGVSCRKLAQQLVAEGVPSAGGGRWVGTNVAKTLRNPIYKGDPEAYRYQGYAARTKARKRGLPVESWSERKGVTIQGGAPAIVSHEVWQEVQNLIAQHRSQSSRNTIDPTEALLRSGFAVCGYCGFNLRHHKARQKWDGRYGDGKYRDMPRTYACDINNRLKYGCSHFEIYGEVLDNAVWSHVMDKLATPEEIVKRLQDRSTEDPTRGDREIVERQIAETDKRLKNIRSAIPSIEDEEFRSTIIQQANDLTDRRKRLVEELNDLLRQFRRWNESEHQLASMTDWIEEVRDKFTNSRSWEQKRSLLRALGIKVRVFRKDHDPRVIVDWEVSLGVIESTPIDVSNAIAKPKVKVLQPMGVIPAPERSSVVDTFANRGIHSRGTEMIRISFALAV